MTAAYLSGKRKINFPKSAKKPDKFIEIIEAYENNLQHVNVKFLLVFLLVLQEFRVLVNLR